MKVLSYLQYMQLPPIPRVHCIKYLYENKYLEKYDNMSYYYSQTFKPELIAEYFEGWDLGYEGETIVNYISDEVHIEIPSDLSYMQIMNHNEQKWFTNNFPRTLDDFITDCQRAGIELEWRQ